MLGRYELDGMEVNSVELKVLLCTKGIDVPTEELHSSLGEMYRIAPPDDPFACNCLLLPDDTIVHMANVGSSSPFSIDLSDGTHLNYEEEFITSIRFPPASDFYDQRTSSGMPFNCMDVLQGLDVLSFHYLWPCEYAKAGFPCQFCNPGAITHQMARVGHPEPPFLSPEDVAEVVDYAVNVEGVASYVQITGGSTMNAGAECSQVAEMLEKIDEVAGLDSIRGEILVYTSPPANSPNIDTVFDAGADKVACDIEVWDMRLVARTTPGKIRFAGIDLGAQ